MGEHAMTPRQARMAPLYWPRWIVLIMVVGMVAVLAPIIVISGSATATAPAKGNYVPQTRTYFIGADEVDWNYAPTGSDQITGKSFDETAAVFTQQGPQRIGSTYIKSLYREYTNSSFRTLKPRLPTGI